MADNSYKIQVEILKLKDELSNSLRNAAKEIGSLENAVDGLNKKLEEQERGRERLAKATSDQSERQRAINADYEKEIQTKQKLISLTDQTAAAQLRLARASEQYNKAERDREDPEERALRNFQLIQARTDLERALFDANQEKIRQDIDIALQEDKKYQSAKRNLDQKQQELDLLEQEIAEKQYILDLNKDSDNEAFIKRTEDEKKALDRKAGSLRGLITQNEEYVASLKSIRESEVASIYQREAQELSALFEQERQVASQRRQQNAETQRLAEQQSRDRKKIIQDLDKETAAMKQSGYVQDRIYKQREENIDRLRKSFAAAAGDLKEFDKRKEKALKVDQTDINRLTDAFSRFKGARETQAKYGKIAQEADIAGNQVVKIDAELQTAKAEAQAAESKAVIEGIIGHIESTVDIDKSELLKSIPEIESIMKVITRDRKIDIEPDLKEGEFARKVTTVEALSGAFQSVKEGLEGASRGVAAFDNLIRGLLVLTVALFFQQIFIAAVGLGAALLSLASSAVAAGAALGGALAAGAAQALPALGVLAAFANRVTNVFNAVKQANLLQQQESYKSGQAATKQAQSLDGVVAAQQRVKEAQDKITEARKKARETLEDLIASQQRENITLERAQLNLNKAVASGSGSLAVASAQLDLDEARKKARRTSADIRSRQRTGIEGSPEVTEAKKQLEDAQRGLKQAQTSADQAGASVSAAGGKLDFLLSNLSKAEKNLYEALLRLQKAWLRFSQTITEPLIVAFTGAVNRVTQILRSAPIIALGKNIAQALAGSFNQIFNFLLSDQVIGRLIALGSKFQDSLRPITNIAINLARIFLDIAEAGVPVLDKLLNYFDKLIQRFADFLDSSKGKNALADFFDKGTESLFKFFDLLGAVGRLIIAIIGPAGGLNAGNNVLDLLTKSIDNFTEKIKDGDSKVGKFFRQVFDNTPRLLQAFAPVFASLGNVIAGIFTEQGIKNVEGFGKFLAEVVIPAIGTAVNTLGKLTTQFVAFIQTVPLASKALELFLAGILTFGVIARVSALFAPFKELNKFLFTGIGKKNIFKIFSEDVDGAGSKLRTFINSVKESNGILFPERRRALADKAMGRLDALDEVGDLVPDSNGVLRNKKGQFVKSAKTSGGIKGAATRGLRKTPGVGKFLMGAGTLGGSAALAETFGPEAAGGVAATAGAALGPVAAVAAVVAAVVGAIALLLAYSGRLDDVWKAIKKTFTDVFSVIKDALGELAKEITGEKSIKAAFNEINNAVKTFGNILADVLIPLIKIIGIQFGAQIVTVIKVVTAVVRAIKGIVRGVIEVFSGLKEFWQGVFSLDGDKILSGLSKIAGGILGIWKSLGKLVFDVITAPFKALISLVDKIFPSIGQKIESVFAGVINFFIKGINTAIDGINAVSPFGDIDKIPEVQSSSQKKAAAKRETAPIRGSRSGAAAGRFNQTTGTQQRPKKAETKQQRRANNADSEKFLSTFDEDTVKMSDEITKKLATYWRRLRAAAKESSDVVRREVNEMRTGVGRAMNRMVRSANSDLIDLNQAFRKRFVNISNIVANQMQNASEAVYKGANYMKNTLNKALDDIGAKSGEKMSVTFSRPRIKAEEKAGGGWIGNRGERGTDQIPTMLGRGEAVLNWGQQKVVEPALRQTYGFGLDDMFARTKGYHAGGPSKIGGGLARGGRAPLFRSGRASWFGGPNDGMNTGTAIGVPDTTPGIALYNQGTLRKYFDVYAPNGRWKRLRQIDIGPAPWTGKILDITSAALKYFGFNEKNFPTGVGNWKIYGPYGSGGGGGGGTGGTAAEHIAQGAVRGAQGAIRNFVSKNTRKMVDEANKYLDSKAPVDVPVSGGGSLNVKGLIAQVRRAISWAKAHGWTGQVTSGYRSDAEQLRIWNSGIRPAAKPIALGGPGSNHSRGEAIDVSDWQGFLRAMRTAPANARLKWFGPGDEIHFSVTGRAQGGRVGGLKHYASGGHVDGPDGQQVPIMAHAGEWVLNRRQQNMIAGIAGTTADRLKGMLGFSGGPTSFAGGGSIMDVTRGIRRTATTLPTLSTLDNLSDIEKAVLDGLRAVIRGAREIVVGRGARSVVNTIKRIEKKLEELKKGDENAEEKKQIKLLEDTLKGLKNRKDFDNLLQSVRQLTGDNGEGGVLAVVAARIKKVFDDTARAIGLRAAGLKIEGGKITRIQGLKEITDAIDPVAIAEAERASQETLIEGLNNLRTDYQGVLENLQKASKRLRSSADLSSRIKKDTKTVDDLGERITKLKEGDESDSEKKTIERLEKRKSDTEKRLTRDKTNLKKRLQIDGELNSIQEKINDAENQIIEAEKARLEAEQKVFEETTKALLRLKNIEGRTGQNNLTKTLNDIGSTYDALTDTYGSVSDPIAAVRANLSDAVQIAKDKKEILRQRLAEASAKAAQDPRWQAIADELQSQFNDAVADVATKTQEAFTGVISAIETQFNRGETARGFIERGVALAERTMGVLSGGYNSSVYEARRRNQVAEQDALRGTIAQLMAIDTSGLNDQQRQDLADKIEENTKKLEESIQTTRELDLTNQKLRADAILNRTQRNTGLIGSAKSIFDQIDRLTGGTNTAAGIRAAQATGNALQGERGALITESNNAISQGLFGQTGTDLLQQLLTSFSTGDAASFASLLLDLGPQIAQLGAELGPTQAEAFNTMVDALVNNTLATTENTANLQELNGLANQTQPFSTTSWTRFRAAIFNGIGDVLPQFQVPAMATGGYITKGGLFELHPGEFVINASQNNVPSDGDINITVNEANKPLDVTALASRIAFEKRTRK